MDWQLPLTILLVAAAVGYLVRQTWRAWIGSKKAGCGSGCGCASKSPVSTPSDQAKLIPIEQITLRRREN